MSFDHDPPAATVRETLTAVLLALLLGAFVSWVYLTRTPPKPGEVTRVVFRDRPLDPGTVTARTTPPRTVTVYRRDTVRVPVRTACPVVPAALTRRDTVVRLLVREVPGGERVVERVVRDTVRLVQGVIVPTTDTSRTRPAVEVTPHRVRVYGYDPADGSGRLFEYAVPDPVWGAALTARLYAEVPVAHGRAAPAFAWHPALAAEVAADVRYRRGALVLSAVGVLPPESDPYAALRLGVRYRLFRVQR